MEAFKERGLRIVAVSTDPPEINGPHRAKLGLSFPILSDTNTQTLRRFDLLHASAGPKGSDIAKPAEILVDSNGVVKWMFITENASVRADPEQVLQAWDNLGK